MILPGKSWTLFLWKIITIKNEQLKQRQVNYLDFVTVMHHLR